MGNVGGRKSKFMDRLFNMVRIRLRKKNINNSKDGIKDSDKLIKDKVDYIKKNIGNDRNNFIIKDNKTKKNVKVIRDYRRFDRGINNSKNNNHIIKENSKDNSIDNKIVDGKRDINNRLKESKLKNIGVVYRDKNNNDDVFELEAKIIKKIIKKIDNSICELDVLESELYFLDKDNKNELELEKIKDIRNKIIEINKKIEHIKSQYDILKNNYYFEDIIDLDDDMLICDIINYKRLVYGVDGIHNLNREYKLFDEYKELYNKLSEVTELKNSLIEDNNKKITIYGDRDIKYNKIKDSIIRIDDNEERIKYEIDRQNEFMNKLLSSIDIINKNEYNIYKVKGIGELLSSSLKYIGLLLVSPLSGLIPSIAINTIATKKLITNIRNNMSIETVKKIEYSAIDYDNDLRNKIYDINIVDDMVDDAITDVLGFKNDFLKQYDSRIKGYEETLDKIFNIERLLLNNKKKISIIKNKLNINVKKNSEKIAKVKKLNEVNK